MNALFPESYEESRARFRGDLARVQTMWRDAHLQSHCINAAEDVTIDWIEAHPLTRQDKLLIFTTGEHGVEGYVGSAMLQIFIEDYLPRLDPTTTGLLLVHSINPWGMKYRRRTNAHNVDLNRNFLWNAEPNKSFNPDYARLAMLLMPRGRVGNLAWHKLVFLAKLLWHNARFGAAKIRGATLIGQVAFPQGIFYGGETTQAETCVLKDLLREWIGAYARIVHLDMHTGYGPRDQMQLVNSWMEPIESREFEERFNYPRVSKATASEFYEIRGDLIDYVYTLARMEFPSKRLYSTTFEFGTLGDSVWNAIVSLRTSVLENQAYWYGADDDARWQIAREFDDLFAPRDEVWRACAIADARQAFDGILRAEGFLA